MRPVLLTAVVMTTPVPIAVSSAGAAPTAVVPSSAVFEPADATDVGRPQQATTLEVDQIVQSIDDSGRFIDPALPAGERGVDVESAIDRANAAGIAVIIATGDADVAGLLGEVVDRLVAEDAALTSVLAFDDVAIEADIEGVTVADIDRGIDGFNAGFEAGGNAAAIDGFVAETVGPITGSTATTLPAGDDGETGTDETAGSSTVVPWLILGLVAIVAFFGLRFLVGRRRRRAAEQAELELDRAEIGEQLRSNADRVIDLGDPVIASRDTELIGLYEEATTTYQAVSLGLADATTVAEIDSLDDRIDHAEWQLAVIEARLAGRPEPRSPEQVERDLAPAPPAARPDTGPALGPDESVFDRRPGPSSPTGRSVPSPRRQGGGLGSLGGGLGDLLIGILLGQAGRPRSMSRRGRQRWSQSRPASAGPGSTGLSLPGPFSRPRARGGRGGSSTTAGRRPSGRSRSGGSRSGRSRSGGSRSSSGRSRSGRRR